MPQIARKESGETWREAVSRIAGRQGLAAECLEVFDQAVARGDADSEAARDALYEWDCLDYEPDQSVV